MEELVKGYTDDAGELAEQLIRLDLNESRSNKGRGRGRGRNGNQGNGNKKAKGRGRGSPGGRGRGEKTVVEFTPPIGSEIPSQIPSRKKSNRRGKKHQGYFNPEQESTKSVAISEPNTADQDNEPPMVVINPFNGKQYSKRYFEILAKRKQLPVYEFKKTLLQLFRDNQVLLVVGETGNYSSKFLCLS